MGDALKGKDVNLRFGGIRLGPGTLVSGASSRSGISWLSPGKPRQRLRRRSSRRCLQDLLGVGLRELVMDDKVHN